MLHGSRLPAVRPEHERVKTPLSSEVVQRRDVGEHVVDVVRVGRVLPLCPLLGGGHVRIKHWVLWLGLVIHRVKANYILQETVEVGVGGR